jgi:hypothetical protein
MATRTVRAFANQWQLVADATCSYRVAGDAPAFFVESATVPTEPPEGHSVGTQTFKTCYPRFVYDFFPNLGTSLYVFPQANGVVVEVDDRPFYDTVRTIEYAHNAVHTDTFAIANETVTGIDTGPANARQYLVVAPADLELHIIFNVVASNSAFVGVYYQPTYSAVGTAITHMRPNLYSTKNILTTYHSPTVSNIGTLIWQTRIPGNAANAFNQRIGAGARNGEEIVLPGGEAIFVSINPEVNDTTVSVANEYYEVPAGSNDPN